MTMPHFPATALSYVPDNGLYPTLDNHFHSGPGIQPPHPGLHPGIQPPHPGLHPGVIPPMPSSVSSNHPPSGVMVPHPHIPQVMPQPIAPTSISSNYPDSVHAPFPAHHNAGHHPFHEEHSNLSKRDLKKISKAEYKMEKEKYKALKKAEKKAYKAQKKALKKQGYCIHCDRRGSCSCSSSSSD